MSYESSPSVAKSLDSWAILRALFPGAQLGGVRGGRRLLAVPRPEAARLVFPERGRLAGRTFRRMRRPTNRVDQAVAAVAARSLIWGAGRALPRRLAITLDEEQWSIEDELSRVLGTTVRVGIFLGPPRANRKPVLHVYDPTGRFVAVVKVGINELTSRLARQESRALGYLAQARMTTVMVPRLLAVHEWRGLTMVVQSPLHTWGLSRPGTPELQRLAFLEIARVRGVSHLPLRGSPYVDRLRSQVSRVADGTIREQATRTLDGIASSHEVEFGSWHGDLTDWNMSVVDGQALVWDWERFASEVPVGFDALHHHFLPSTKGPEGHARAAGMELMKKSSSLIAPLGVDRAVADSVAVLYLIELAARFSRDGQADTGVRGGQAREWLLPALEWFQAKSRGGN